MSPSSGAAVDHHRHQSRRARARPHSAHVRSLPLLPARRLARGRGEGGRAHRRDSAGRQRPRGDVRKGFVYKRVPHITLKSIAQNPDITRRHEPRRDRRGDRPARRDASCSSTSPTRTARRSASPAASPSRACRRTESSTTTGRRRPVPRPRRRPTPRRPRSSRRSSTTCARPACRTRQGRGDPLRPARPVRRDLDPGRGRVHRRARARRAGSPSASGPSTARSGPTRSRRPPRRRCAAPASTCWSSAASPSTPTPERPPASSRRLATASKSPSRSGGSAGCASCWPA